MGGRKRPGWYGPLGLVGACVLQGLAMPAPAAEGPDNPRIPQRPSAPAMDQAQIQNLIADLERMGLHDAAQRIRLNNALPYAVPNVVPNAGSYARPTARPGLPELSRVPERMPQAAPLPRPPLRASGESTALPAMPVADAAPAVAATGQAVELMQDRGGWVHVRGFQISHSNRYPESELQALLKDFVDKELNVPQLRYAASLLANYYRARGVTVRAVLPEQTLEQGMVQIRILESAVSGPTKGR